MDLWHMDIRRFGAALPLAVLHARRAPGGLRDLLRHPLPRPRAPGRAGRCAPRAPTPGTPSTAPPSARSPAGSGSTGTSPTPPAATRRCARAAGRACTGRRRSAPSTAPRASAAGLFDESSFAKLEIARAGRRRAPASGCATTASRATSGTITYTQMLNRRGGIECDFTVTRLDEELLLDRHRHGVRQPRPRAGSARHAPGDGRVRVADVTARWACFGAVGPAGARHPRAAHAADLGTRLPVTCAMREITVGDVPVRALRVTFVGELGWELYCPTEYGAGLWRTLWEAGRRARAASPAATARSTRCGSRRATASGRADITPDETPLRGRPRLLREARQGRRLRRRARRSARRRRRRRRRAAAASAWCSTTRARWRSATSRCAVGGEVARAA